MKALLNHFKKMQTCVANYLPPESYTPQFGEAAGLDSYPEGTSAKDDAFVNDMIYALDGPEQRAAEAAFAKFEKDLRAVVATASDPGNACANQYMRGMANGLILALAIFDGVSPEYISAEDCQEHGEGVGPAEAFDPDAFRFDAEEKVVDWQADADELDGSFEMHSPSKGEPGYREDLTFSTEEIEAGQGYQRGDPVEPPFGCKPVAVDNFPDEKLSGVDPMPGKLSDGR